MRHGLALLFGVALYVCLVYMHIRNTVDWEIFAIKFTENEMFVHIYGTHIYPCNVILVTKREKFTAEIFCVSEISRSTIDLDFPLLGILQNNIVVLCIIIMYMTVYSAT